MATSVSNGSGADVSKNKKPSNSAFKQQRLAAWQPILTAGTVLPTFFVIGIAFIPVGIGLLYFSNDVKEFQLDYTYCKAFNSNKSCSEVLAEGQKECKCRISFNLAEDFEGKVYMYYGLTNFYQNHRRYVKSRDDSQLLGKNKDLSTDCEPYGYGTKADGTRVKFAPCGAIANSLFNDTLKLFRQGGLPVPLSNESIAWPSDKERKFHNPPGFETDPVQAFKGTVKPPNWARPVYELDPNHPDNNGYVNEDLIVWMRTAALPTFRKLYRRIDHTAPGYKNKLSKGDYILEVDYRYPVVSFDGTKRMILSTTSLLGGKNPFLGIGYIVVGCICLVMGIVFLVIHIKYGKHANEMTDVGPRTGY